MTRKMKFQFVFEQFFVLFACLEIFTVKTNADAVRNEAIFQQCKKFTNPVFQNRCRYISRNPIIAGMKIEESLNENAKSNRGRSFSPFSSCPETFEELALSKEENLRSLSPWILEINKDTKR